jgi:hypothetical protein
MQRLSHFFLDTTVGQVLLALAVCYATFTGVLWALTQW